MEEPDLAAASSDSANEVCAADIHHVKSVVENKIPITLPSVKAIVISMEHEDSAFIEKAVQYIGSLEGARNSDMTVMTNARLPTRFLFSVTQLPKTTLSDLMHLDGMTSFVRFIKIDLDQNKLQFDVWKKKGKTSRKRDRSTSPVAIIDNDIDNIDLSSLHEEDKMIAIRVINSIKTMPEVVCQFKVTATMSPPNSYMLHLTIKDILDYARVKKFHRAFRAFVENIAFNFPEKTLDIKIKRLN